jgi:hypothetical protein
MKINICNYEQALGMDAILSKYARMIERELIDLGHEVSVSSKPEKADWNHHINFISYIPSGGKDTTMITHITGDKNHSEKEKIEMCREQSKTAIGICMNKGIKDKLVKAGIPENRLAVALHAHDGNPRRPKIIAICSNLYADGRKREDMFSKLFLSIKNKKGFIFRIMGNNWLPLLDKLKKKGIQVQLWQDFMGEMYQQILNTSDFLLYTGDEDSLAQSMVDAKNAGLRIIAPPNADLEVELPFKNQEELNSIFNKLDDNPVKDWNWSNYVKEHLKIWEKI